MQFAEVEGEIVVKDRGVNLHIWFETHLVFLVTPALPESLICEHHITPGWEGLSSFPMKHLTKTSLISLAVHVAGKKHPLGSTTADATMDQTNTCCAWVPNTNFYISFGLSWFQGPACSFFGPGNLHPPFTLKSTPWKGSMSLYLQSTALHEKLRGKSRTIQQNTASGTLNKASI